MNRMVFRLRGMTHIPRYDSDRPTWWAPGQIKPLDTVQEVER